ncbi:hypothetical protein [Fictibacillus sp. NRS-1165]|uniref:hypothetical protein n=1 Tax=Fictibacillus sp. NRS-1165 TaxID=3144463 RepID=UPI003D1CE1BC
MFRGLSYEKDESYIRIIALVVKEKARNQKIGRCCWNRQKYGLAARGPAFTNHWNRRRSYGSQRTRSGRRRGILETEAGGIDAFTRGFCNEL